MKKLLSIILATAMIMTLFCVVPASAATVTLDSTYFFDDFESGTTTISAKTNIEDLTATEIIDGTSYGRTGKVWSYTYPKTNASGGNYYADIVIPNVLTDDKASLKNCAVGTTIKVTFDYKFTATPTTNVTAMEAWINDNGWKAPGSGSKTVAELADWNTATIQYTIANALAATDNTHFSLRLAQPFTRTQILIDNLEFIKINPNGTAAVTGATITSKTSSAITVDYTSTGATNVLRLLDGTKAVASKIDTGDKTIDIPASSQSSENLSVEIMPISADGVIGTAATAKVYDEKASDYYTIHTFDSETAAATPTTTVTGSSGSGSTAVVSAEGEGKGGGKAIRITVGSADSNNKINVPNLSVKAGHATKITFDYKLITEITTGAQCFGFFAHNGNWLTNFCTIDSTNTSTWQKGELFLDNRTGSADCGSITFRCGDMVTVMKTSSGNAELFMDNIEIQDYIVEDATAAIPTITDPTMSITDNVLTVDYTFATTGGSAGDASIIKVFGDEKYIGSYVAGGSFTLTDSYDDVEVEIIPFSKTGHFGTRIYITPSSDNPSGDDRPNGLPLDSSTYIYETFAGQTIDSTPTSADGVFYNFGNTSSTAKIVEQGKDGGMALKLTLASDENGTRLRASGIHPNPTMVIPANKTLTVTMDYKLLTNLKSTANACLGLLYTTYSHKTGTQVWADGTSTAIETTASDDWRQVTVSYTAGASDFTIQAIRWGTINGSMAAATKGESIELLIDNVEIKLEDAVRTGTQLAKSTGKFGADILSGTAISSAKVIFAVYDANGKMVDSDIVSVSSVPANIAYEVVPSKTLNNATGNKLKVMLWQDNTSTYMPLADVLNYTNFN